MQRLLLLLASIAAMGSFLVQLEFTRLLFVEPTLPMPPMAVFYNVYIPTKSVKAAQNAHRIVEEQLNQLPTTARVYYNTIGAHWQIPRDDVTFLQHYDIGFENVTLQSVYDYCQKHPDESVLYMHSKGSFHKSARNDRWRHNLMRGVTACRLDRGCNVCGLQVQTLPALHVPGNVWMADCEYILRLVPPREFEAATDRTFGLRVPLSRNVYGEQTWAMGTDRYTWEHWIGTHPTVRPCDVSDVVDTSVWWQEEHRPLGEWGLIPKHSWRHQHWKLKPPPNKTALMDRATRLTDWNLLPGMIVRWTAMYQEIPPEDSWIWNTPAYPDHEYWKVRVQESLVKSSKQQRASKAKPAPLLLPSEEPTAAPPEPVQVTLFYNIYVPLDEAGAANALRIIEEQMTQLNDAPTFSTTYRGSTLYYNTIGNNTEATRVLMDRLCTNLVCEHMQHYDEGFEDVTLDKLYDYCHDNEESSVLYFHSKGSFHNWKDHTNENWRRHLTAAVSRDECLRPPDESCNVCGLQYFPVWSSFVPGNFFVSKCSYVQRLLRPSEFGRQMTLVMEDVLQLRADKVWDMTLYNPKKGGVLGVDRYSSEHWIASHPTVIPCDLSRTADFRYWVQGARNVSDEATFALAPREDLSGPWFRLQKRDVVLSNRTRRRREFFLLAGALFKWYQLYDGELPPADSWVWRWFPDGADWWEKGVPYIRQHGLNVQTMRGLLDAMG